MKIAFRHVPFSAGQIEKLNALAAQGGYETLWCKNGAIPPAQELQDCEILMGYFPADLIQSLPNLKWVQTPAAGVEKLCGDIYRNSDALLTNCSGAFGVAISEYMISGLLMLMRNMPAYLQNQRAHVWECVGCCRSIYGSTITVIGMGNIGSEFAARAKAMGAYIRGVRRTMSALPANFDEVYTSNRLAEAVQGADAVVMCLPGTAATTGMASREVIDAMGPNTILVNCGRGYTIDQQALTEALQEKRIAGAVLDVFETEPLDSGSPLWDMKNVIITPHISGHDDDPVNISFIYEIFADNLSRWIHGQPLTHVVDRTRGY